MSINIVDVSKALQDQLQRDVGVAGFVSEVSRGEYINEDPNNTPWVGVYRNKILYNPRTLGINARNWEGSLTVRVVIQDASMESGAACEELLEEHIKLVTDAIFAERTLGNTVDMINSLDVEYLYNETDRESMYFQTAIITLTLEVATA